MIWYTADWHIGHANIIKYCDRPFDSVEHMDATIFRWYVMLVQPEDTVYVLGDCQLGRRVDFDLALIEAMPGAKHLIIGNHDRSTVKEAPFWKSVNRELEIEDEGRRVLLSHYPNYNFPGKEDGVISLHGHSHGKRGVWPGVKAFDVGVDCVGFKPVTLNEILEGSEA